MQTSDTAQYLNDFAVGDVYEHQRARTVLQSDNAMVTHLTLNTAQVHFNLDAARELMDGKFNDFLVMGGYTTALVIGLTSADMSENAVADIGIDGLRLPNPVYPGDTIVAYSEVLAIDETDDEGVGMLTYRFTGRKSDGVVVVEGVRQVLHRWCPPAALDERRRGQ